MIFLNKVLFFPLLHIYMRSCQIVVQVECKKGSKSKFCDKTGTFFMYVSITYKEQDRPGQMSINEEKLVLIEYK